MIDGFYTWPNKEHGLPYNHEQPFLFHINGVCEGDITLPQNHIDKKSYFNFSNQKTSPISFAWEDEIKEYETVFIKERKRHLQNIARRTDILVVIGYSFPFFNRKIDKLIFESLMDSLERIYIQDKRAGMLAEEIKSKLPLMPDVKRNIVPITDCSYYHIPYEL